MEFYTAIWKNISRGSAFPKNAKIHLADHITGEKYRLDFSFHGFYNETALIDMPREIYKQRS